MQTELDAQHVLVDFSKQFEVKADPEFIGQWLIIFGDEIAMRALINKDFAAIRSAELNEWLAAVRHPASA